MKTAPKSAAVPRLRLWPPSATLPFPFFVSLAHTSSLRLFAAVLDAMIPSSFDSSVSDFDGTVYVATWGLYLVLATHPGW